MKFSVIGNKAYRDAHEANVEFTRIVRETGEIPDIEVVEIETTALVNDLFRVAVLQVADKVSVTNTFFVRTFEEIAKVTGQKATISYEQIAVFPFREAGATSKERVQRSGAPKSAHG